MYAPFMRPLKAPLCKGSCHGFAVTEGLSFTAFPSILQAQRQLVHFRHQLIHISIPTKAVVI